MHSKTTIVRKISFILLLNLYLTVIITEILIIFRILLIQPYQNYENA
jgi:hypothetical protein